MPIYDQLQKCAVHDNLEEFNRLIAQIDSETQRHIVTMELLYSIVVHGSINILNRVLEDPWMLDHIANNPINIDMMLIPAATHGRILVVNRLLEIPFFMDYVISHPYEVIIAATGDFSHHTAVLNRFIELTAIGDCIAAWDNQAFICARAYYNQATSDRLLEFPDVFDFVDSCYDKQRTTGDCISSFLENYFSKLNSRMAEFRKANNNIVFNMDARESKLCFLILRNLIKTYSKRDELRQDAIRIAELRAARTGRTMLTRAKMSVTHLRELIRPSRENIHLKRIIQLVAVPGVQEIADSNNNELLRLSIGLGNRNEIVSVLRNIVAVRDYERTHPIDEAHEINNPIDFEQQYTLTHPTAAVIAYEVAYPRPARITVEARSIPKARLSA